MGSTAGGTPEEGSGARTWASRAILAAFALCCVATSPPRWKIDAAPFPMPAGLRNIDVVGFELGGTPNEIDARARDFVKRLLHDVLEGAAAA